MNWRRSTITFGCVLALAAMGCSGDDGGSEDETTPPPGGSDTSTDMDMGEDTGTSGGDTTNGGNDTMVSSDTGDMGSPSTPDFQVVDCGNADVATEVKVGSGLQYQPTTAQVPQGKAVRWTWAQNLNFQHNVIAGGTCGSPNPDQFESQTTSSSGTTFCVTFNADPGSYEYQCTVGNHCSSGMKGTIEVTSN